MRILLHALAAREYGGAERHLRGLLSALKSHNHNAEWLLYVNKAVKIGTVPANTKVYPVLVKSALHRLFWDQIVLPIVARQQKVEVIWSLLGFGAIRPPVPQIIFQRNSIYYCDYFMKVVGAKDRLLVLAKRRLQWLAMRRSSAIITPTVAMRDMIRSKHSDISLSKFHVIPHAVSSDSQEQQLPSPIAEKLAGRGDNIIRLLYVGHILPFKAIHILLETVGILHKNGYPVKLFMTGQRQDWPSEYDRIISMITKLQLERHVGILGKVPVTSIGMVYRQCDVLMYPSVCESFGFPLAEAMLYGVPIVAADTPVNREVASGGALYYPSFDSFAAASQVQKLLDEPDVRATLLRVGRGHCQSAYFGWDEYVRRCMAV